MNSLNGYTSKHNFVNAAFIFLCTSLTGVMMSWAKTAAMSRSEWYSDFRQRDMWAGPGYRAAKPAYIIYRK
ncbi:hypothetical protein GT695_00415 [Citrobacter amalonaticus]|jgi:hypothetical protein|nr:hypothetical protein [Citrobacter amalonaticus]MZK92057.1 hypothetical protein [Citrobacter amalonaticus]MZL02745.1 hypothetical protein [Citrobacter amalonaticus]MZL12495.1 hypothetical protein [Citrobacter amalonaticus]MZL24139.1 hypothetical protein [Citrobacter amalonaticus]